MTLAESSVSSLIEILGPPSARRRLARGETLFLRGQVATHVFAVDVGRVRLRRCLADGRTLTLAVAGPQETLAEAALFAEAYHCDAVAEVASAVWMHPADTARARLRADPVATERFLGRLAAQLRHARGLAEVRAMRRAADRLFAYLDLLEVTGSKSPRDRPLTALAAELGLAPETLYRTLRRLRSSGQIAMDRPLRRVGIDTEPIDDS
ncbi:MAG: Crp/Fnr family transcriptional regulator [Acidobacteriota bacterium]